MQEEVVPLLVPSLLEKETLSVSMGALVLLHPCHTIVLISVLVKIGLLVNVP